MEPSLALMALMSLIAMAAGFVDAIAGGGGLLTVPALMAAGLTPIEALGTNKAQGVFGVFGASVRFISAREVALRPLLPAILLTFLGAALGACALRSVQGALLAQLIPLLLIASALYLLLSPRVSDTDTQRRLGMTSFGLLIGVSVGFYDGFFGPGTGAFFVVAFVALLGMRLTRATAHSKVLNLTSNAAALWLLADAGEVVWSLAIGMALGQLIGGWLGAHLVIAWGARLIRPMLVAISLSLAVTLLFRTSSSAPQESVMTSPPCFHFDLSR